MFMHSCCCILFCVAGFEVRFQIDLNLHFEIALEKLEKENEFPFLPFPAFSPSWPAFAWLASPFLHAGPARSPFCASWPSRRPRSTPRRVLLSLSLTLWPRLLSR